MIAAPPNSISSEQEIKTDLQREYDLRFRQSYQYRIEIWKILARDFFQPLIPASSYVLDLGCGWGEFINQIRAEKKYGMDLNPESRQRLARDVQFIEQDCSVEWPLPDESLDVVFTSNFFEHLYTKDDLQRTLGQIHRCLKVGGRLICLGPNIKYLPGDYWDFWDHYIPLTEQSLRGMLELTRFEIERCTAKFLPYTMTNKRPAPLWLVRLYLKIPWVWKFMGKQFLVIGRARAR